MTRKPRRELTIDDIFDKKKKLRYLAILILLDSFFYPDEEKKLKFSHLKYVFVKNYKIKTEREREKLNSFFWTTNVLNEVERLKRLYDSGKINSETYLKFTKLTKKDEIERLRYEGYLSEDIKLPSEGSLRYAIGKLKKLNLITTQKDKKGYDFIILTDIGHAKIDRWSTHNLIDNIPDNSDHMKELMSIVIDCFYDYITKEKIKKINASLQI